MVGLTQVWKRPRVLVYALWTLGLAGLFWRNHYHTFLRPEFGFLLLLGVLGFVALIWVEWERETAPATLRTWLGVGVMLIPLLFLLKSQTFTLDTYALNKRSVGMFAAQAQTQAAPANPLPQAAAPTRSDAQVEVRLDELMRSPETFKQRQISVVGKVQHSSKVAECLGANSLVVFRFKITCCTADAQPLALAVQLDAVQSFPVDTWIQAEGVFGISATKYGALPALQHARVEKIKPPENAYLY